ncbi:universal stress protein [Bradyrhizobium sp. NAS80.1]|uniref:universal stress protein n=1 Tax=Bradyrhizobium sp. NAS80.1 TaxID=1680159 RepID=UPI00095A7A45|nr:universal stress protein [Bradyrhizobium sp. NAS80.1]OKO84239.1 universal stress protein [Bradyrhizobium sp. NAS80.1]
MYRHILIPTDGSELAERGVAHGLALAKSVGARVSIIYVVEPLLAVTGDFASVLDHAANRAREVGVPCETIQVENVPPDQAIVAAAEDQGCDLIVMSWHGRSGLSTLLIGSVTNKVMTYAKTPVLVCR